MEQLDEQRETARLSHGDAGVLRAGHGKERPGHVIFIVSPQHGQKTVHHLHLLDTVGRDFILYSFFCFYKFLHPTPMK